MVIVSITEGGKWLCVGVRRAAPSPLPSLGGAFTLSLFLLLWSRKLLAVVWGLLWPGRDQRPKEWWEILCSWLSHNSYLPPFSLAKRSKPNRIILIEQKCFVWKVQKRNPNQCQGLSFTEHYFITEPTRKICWCSAGHFWSCKETTISQIVTSLWANVIVLSSQ